MVAGGPASTNAEQSGVVENEIRDQQAIPTTSRVQMQGTGRGREGGNKGAFPEEVVPELPFEEQVSMGQRRSSLRDGVASWLSWLLGLNSGSVYSLFLCSPFCETRTRRGPTLQRLF